MNRALSPRQRQIIELASKGMTAPQIADELGIAVGTVRTTRESAVRRLGAKNTAHACVLYHQERAETAARELLRQRILQEVTAY